MDRFDRKLLAKTLGYYLKAHEKQEKIVNCFPDEWAQDVDLQIAFKRGWKEAEDETPVEMNVTMNFKSLSEDIKENIAKEFRKFDGAIDRMHRNMGLGGAQTNTAIPKVEIDQSFIKGLDRGSCVPGKFTWDAATGKALDDFAIFYRIPPRQDGEIDEFLRMRIKYAHEYNHPNRYPGGKLPPPPIAVDLGKGGEHASVLVYREDGGNWKITPPDAYEANEKIAMDFARERIENLGLKRLDLGQSLAAAGEPGVGYNDIGRRWKEWQAANQRAFGEEKTAEDEQYRKYYFGDEKPIQVHSTIKLDGTAIARAVNEFDARKENKGVIMTSKYEGSWKNEWIVNDKEKGKK